MSTVTRLTRLIHVDSGAYPVTLDDMPTYLPFTCIGQTVDSALLSDLGFEVVESVPPPAGDVVTEGTPEFSEGAWRQTWVVRPFNGSETAGKLQERKAVLQAQAESLRISAFAKGFPYRFANDAVYHVQVRGSDRGNISDLRTIAKEAIADNREMTFRFRVYENISVSLSAPEMVAMADQTFVQVNAGYQSSWDYKDAIEDATTLEELPEPPAEYFLVV